jgi:hypothetical protein
MATSATRATQRRAQAHPCVSQLRHDGPPRAWIHDGIACGRLQHQVTLGGILSGTLFAVTATVGDFVGATQCAPPFTIGTSRPGAPRDSRRTYALDLRLAKPSRSRSATDNGRGRRWSVSYGNRYVKMSLRRLRQRRIPFRTDCPRGLARSPAHSCSALPTLGGHVTVTVKLGVVPASLPR